ncbi:hypothetical protein [Helicobacter canis]|nr:hypothetical protein [Helicobacter canis]
MILGAFKAVARAHTLVVCNRRHCRRIHQKSAKANAPKTKSRF